MHYELADGSVVVILHWSNRFGKCHDCDYPAAYIACENDYSVAESLSDLPESLRLCSMCAAFAASQGEPIKRIDELLNMENDYDPR